MDDRERNELAVSATGKVLISGIELPAPTAGVMALLELLKSPFVSDDHDGGIIHLDVLRAMYVLQRREEASRLLLQIHHYKRLADNLAKATDAVAAYMAAEQQRRIADLNAAFDAEVMAWAEAQPPVRIDEATRDLMFYLTLATGFERLPEGSKKKT